MGKKVFVVGDTHTKDRFKIEGFIKGFSKISDVNYIHPPLKNNMDQSQSCDILFGESGDWLDMNYTNIRNVFIWCVIDPNLIIPLAERYTETRFFMCSKSVIHSTEVSEEYIRKYGTTGYLHPGYESIDLITVREILDKAEIIDKNLYKISENLYYLYLPCSLASSEIGTSGINRDIDITYFGTRENRPGVSNILNSMEARGYNVVYNQPNIYIEPHQCIEYYKRSIITIHEQVGPVYLEFPVRLGEASYCGSKIFSLDRMRLLQKYANDDQNTPSYESFASSDELIEKAIEYINEYRNGNIKNCTKDYTYDFYCKKILKLAK